MASGTSQHITNLLTFSIDFLGQAPKSSSLTLNFANSTRGILLYFGSSNNIVGCQMINVSSSGNISQKTIADASEITTSKSTGTLVVNNANANYAALMYFITLTGAKPTTAT